MDETSTTTYCRRTKTRLPRSGKTHLFSAVTLVPMTESDSFDVEYVLQMDVGGLPSNWLTIPKF